MRSLLRRCGMAAAALSFVLVTAVPPAWPETLSHTIPTNVVPASLAVDSSLHRVYIAGAAADGRPVLVFLGDEGTGSILDAPIVPASPCPS